MSAISLARATEMFDLVSAAECCPASASAPCIPFLYPDDGCWGRAHEMCRRIIAAGEQPQKVWIFGNLNVITQNNPTCAVQWGWHVAPTLLVATSSGNQTYVVDPALFTQPVPQATWAGVQGDPAPTLIPTGPDVFYRNEAGNVSQTDPTYAQTNTVLTTYRTDLRLRSAAAAGPPPYFSCFSPGPNVQWVGMVAPSATESWFTWGWPARWDVVWTVMPSTPCPGGPQLSWDVAVQRTDSDVCTYWITVKNLTSDPVKFEGRYDVLSF